MTAARIEHFDLFAGIGGFARAMELAEFRVTKRFFSEIDEYAGEIYRRHYPAASELGDITKIKWEEFINDNTKIITGGFPCQDISIAGYGVGIHGSRSGLWYEMHKGISILRPAFVVIENVSALTFRGLDELLVSLAEIGYDAEWYNIRASDVGAPHRRERIYIIAYPQSKDEHQRDLSDADGKHVARMEQGDEEREDKKQTRFYDRARSLRLRKSWAPEPSMGRVADGVPRRVDRIKALGNAIVPDTAAVIFQMLKKCELFI
jgi:DNA (cytosine-5)-methyltransferase 1